MPPKLMRTTKVDSEMAEAAQRFSGDPERASALEAARAFKRSWLELAAVLVQTKRSGAWKRWGFDAFDAYAKAELHLRQETIDKLTGSYQFLEKRAPAVLARDGMDSKVPSYQTIDFLRKAEEHGNASETELRELYTKVIDEGQSLPKVRKAFADKAFPVDDDVREERDKSALRNVAGRLRELLREVAVVPDALRDELTVTLDQLLTLVAKAENDDAAA